MDVAEELVKARRHGYAIGAFNTANLEVTKAICMAAAKFNTPILIQTTPSAIEYAGLQSIFDIVRDEIENSGVKAAIHLDHAKEFEIIKECIKTGYTSVMFDGSKLFFDENMAMTEQVVHFAHNHGVCVEGEVGVIAHEEGGHLSGKARYSTPDQVKRFVEETGVDSIAVSVGNEHGAPRDEKLDLDLLRKIGDMVDIPLVMHGASGLSRGDIREAIGYGVAKFNIDTNIKKAFADRIEHSKESDYREAIKRAMADVEKVVEHYIRLFTGKE